MAGRRRSSADKSEKEWRALNDVEEARNFYSTSQPQEWDGIFHLAVFEITETLGV